MSTPSSAMSSLDGKTLTGRVLLTHDVQTMTRFAFERVDRGDPMPGVIEVRARAAIGDYALRKQMTVAQVERWLGPNLNYEPASRPLE
jgi:hypothetical protein